MFCPLLVDLCLGRGVRSTFRPFSSFIQLPLPVGPLWISSAHTHDAELSGVWHGPEPSLVSSGHVCSLHLGHACPNQDYNLTLVEPLVLLTCLPPRLSLSTAPNWVSSHWSQHRSCWFRWPPNLEPVCQISRGVWWSSHGPRRHRFPSFLPEAQPFFKHKCFSNCMNLFGSWGAEMVIFANFLFVNYYFCR